jgi:hypothetical protein
MCSQIKPTCSAHATEARKATQSSELQRPDWVRQPGWRAATRTHRVVAKDSKGTGSDLAGRSTRARLREGTTLKRKRRRVQQVEDEPRNRHDSEIRGVQDPRWRAQGGCRAQQRIHRPMGLWHCLWPQTMPWLLRRINDSQVQSFVRNARNRNCTSPSARTDLDVVHQAQHIKCATRSTR